MTSIVESISSSAAHAGTVWENLAPDSEDLTHADWALLEATLSESKSISGVECQGVVATSEASPHIISATSPNDALDTDKAYLSAFVAAGNQDWVSLKVIVTTSAFASWGGAQWFDLANGQPGSFVAGTTGGSVIDKGIETVDGGYRVWILVSTNDDDGFGTTWSISPAEADTDNTFAGDDVTITTYIGGVSFIDGPTGDVGYVST